AIHSALQGPLAAPGSVKQFMKPLPQKQFVGSPEEVHVCECAVLHATTAAQSARSVALVSAQQPSVPPRSVAASEQFMVVQSSHAAVLVPPWGSCAGVKVQVSTTALPPVPGAPP